MAKSTFDWNNDKRNNAHTVAPLTDFDEMASKAQQVLALSETSCLPVFLHNASAIYARLEDQGKEAKQSAILLARHERLAHLLQMWETANPIDFYLLKFPAWWLSDRLQRYQERRQHNV